MTRTRRGRLPRVAALAAFAALAALATLVPLATRAAAPLPAAEPPPPLPGDETTLPRPLPRWLLQQAHDGRTLSPEALRGRFQLVTFGFVSCPDVCPTTLAEMKAVLEALGPRAERLQALFISVDPERDTLAVLRDYTAAFDRRIIGLTGPPALVARAAEAFKVRYQTVREPGAPPGAYTVDHSAGLYLVGPDGQLLSRLGYGMPVADIVARVRRWMDAASP